MPFIVWGLVLSPEICEEGMWGLILREDIVTSKALQPAPAKCLRTTIGYSGPEVFEMFSKSWDPMVLDYTCIPLRAGIAD